MLDDNKVNPKGASQSLGKVDTAKLDKRRLPRRVLAAPVNVYDRLSQSFMGRLVNIHTEGLMIMGNHPFTDDRLYQLDLQLPQPVNGREIICIGVDCLWARSEAEHVHWAGCKIIDLSAEAQQDIEALIDLFAEEMMA